MRTFTDVPSFDSPVKLKQFILDTEKAIVSRENVRSKNNFLSFLETRYMNAPRDLQRCISHSVFKFCKDNNPSVRLRALQIFEHKAFIPPDILYETISKWDPQDSNTNISINDHPHYGVIGMCLEDAYPEIRAAAIRVLSACFTTQGVVNSSDILSAVTQLLNDGSTFVRAAAVLGVYQMSTVIDHLVILEDSQLRIVLPVIMDSHSTETERHHVYHFLTRVQSINLKQTSMVLFELGRAANKYANDPKDAKLLISTAYAFGFNNYMFMRNVAFDYCQNTQPFSQAYDLSLPNCYMQLISILASHIRLKFYLPEPFRKQAILLIPTLTQLHQEMKNAVIAEKINHSVPLDILREYVQDQEQNQKHVCAYDDTLKDAVELVSKCQGTISEMSFHKLDQLDGETLVTKYKGTFTTKSNTRFDCEEDPPENIFLTIEGKIHPIPTTTVVLYLTMPQCPAKIFKIDIKPDGSFKYGPSITLPRFRPFLCVKVFICLFDEATNASVIISDKPLERYYKWKPANQV